MGEPYVWNREFAVFYKTLDDEHKVLFDNLRAVEEDPLDEFLVGKMKNSMTCTLSMKRLRSVMPRTLTGTTARITKGSTPNSWLPWTESMPLQRSRISRLPRTGWLSISRTLILNTEES